jgi:predicted HicB family RNase H-like nuclease
MVGTIQDLRIIASKVLEEPPEAEEEETPGATLYLRLPASLKEQVEAAAAEDRLSANAWSMRCLESCVALRKTTAGRAAQ